MPLRKIVIIGPESTGKSTLCEGLATHFGTDWAPEYAREYLLQHGKQYQYGDLLTIARGQLALEERHAAGLEKRWGREDDRVRRNGAGWRRPGGAGQRELGQSGPGSTGRRELGEAGWREAGAGSRLGTDLAGQREAGQNGPGSVEEGPGEYVLTEPILFVDTDMYVMKVWSEFVFGACDAWILDQVATRRYDGYLLCRTDLPWTADELREYPDEGPREQLFHIYRDCMINQSTPWKEIGGTEEMRLAAAIAAVGEMLVQ